MSHRKGHKIFDEVNGKLYCGKIQFMPGKTYEVTDGNYSFGYFPFITAKPLGVTTEDGTAKIYRVESLKDGKDFGRSLKIHITEEEITGVPINAQLVEVDKELLESGQVSRIEYKGGTIREYEYMHDVYTVTTTSPYGCRTDIYDYEDKVINSKAGGHTYDYEYNEEGLLIGITGGGMITEITYDADGNMIEFDSTEYTIKRID